LCIGRRHQEVWEKWGECLKYGKGRRMRITNPWAGNLAQFIISGAYDGVSDSTRAITSGWKVNDRSALSFKSEAND
jgi:hypothetical protein